MIYRPTNHSQPRISAYFEYLIRHTQNCPVITALRPMDFVLWTERWEREYDKAWDLPVPDYKTIDELEAALCV